MAVRSGDDRQVCHRLLQRLASARRAIIGIYFPPIPWPMTLAPTNEAISREIYAEKNLIGIKIIRIMLGVDCTPSFPSKSGGTKFAPS